MVNGYLWISFNDPTRLSSCADVWQVLLSIAVCEETRPSYFLSGDGPLHDRLDDQKKTKHYKSSWSKINPLNDFYLYTSISYIAFRDSISITSIHLYSYRFWIYIYNYTYIYRYLDPRDLPTSNHILSGRDRPGVLSRLHGNVHGGGRGVPETTPAGRGGADPHRAGGGALSVPCKIIGEWVYIVYI